MRAGVVAAACAALVAAAAYLWPPDRRDTAAAAGTTRPYPPPLVACDAVVLRPRRVSPGDRVAFGRVAFVGARVYQVADVGGDGSSRLCAKFGLYVRAGTPTFTLAVPQRWRGRSSIAWGTGIEPSVRIAGCPRPLLVWNGYAGGFYVRERACVPLIIRVADRQTVLRFAIGRPCARAGRET